MKLIYNKKVIELKKCDTFFSRLKGFMFTKNINKALLFDNCNSIHTFFMKQNIDVLLLDIENNIIYYYNNLGKRRIIFPKKNVKKVIELPVDYFNIKLNTKIEIK